MSKKDMTSMWNDIIKILTIAVIIHILLCLTDDYGDLFDEKTLKIFLYLTLGIVIYYLIIKRFTDNCLENQNNKKPKKTKKIDN